MKSDYREFQYCIPDAGDGYNLGTASGSQIPECLNPAVTRYVITWARFKLFPRYKSPSSVTRHGASIGLTWLAGRPKPEFPPLLSASRLGRVLGEGGVKLNYNAYISSPIAPMQDFRRLAYHTCEGCKYGFTLM